MSFILLLACEASTSAPEKSVSAFTGFWTSTAASKQRTCSGQTTDVGFSAFTLLLRAGLTGELEVVEVDQLDFVTEYCVYHFRISRSTASISGPQSCNSVDEIGSPILLTYARDDLTLAADNQAMEETASVDISDGCHEESMAHYARGRP